MDLAASDGVRSTNAFARVCARSSSIAGALRNTPATTRIIHSFVARGTAEKGSVISNSQAPTRGRQASPLAAAAPQQQSEPVAPFALSVIIPVHNDPVNLELSLRALEASEYPDYEVIVVDDGSTDGTAEVAQRRGARVIHMDARSGPAAARNRGARIARHPYLFFLDADVCVQPDTLGLVAAKFRSAPTVEAFFGSYDERPGAPNFLSQYRNLLHHFVHQDGNEEAFSFWSGCGAIRKSTFLGLGGFDTDFTNASIEDIELGSRLREAGHSVELVKSVQVKHMKRWTLWRMIRTDIRDRAIPWTRLVLRQGKIPNDLNLRHSQRLSALLSAGLVATLALGSWSDPSVLLIPLAAFLGLILVDRWTARRPLPRWARIVGSVAGVVAAGATLAYAVFGHDPLAVWSSRDQAALLALAFLLGIVGLNLRFYRFLWRLKHPLFVLLVMPLHVLYYLYSSLAFAIGLGMHLGNKVRRPRLDPQ